MKVRNIRQVISTLLTTALLFTVDAQNAAGGLIKDICARSKTASLLSVGNYLHLKGEVAGTYSSHKIKFQFTAENII